MGLVVDLGLQRFFYGRFDAIPAAVTSLVEQGFTTTVREVVCPEGDKTLAKARVFEAKRTRDGVHADWMSPTRARKILADMRATHEAHGTYASFSWDELDEVGAYDVQDLALVLDGTVDPGVTRVPLAGTDSRVRLIDVDDSANNWRSRHPQARIAAALHKLAYKHYLIVHSA